MQIQLQAAFADLQIQGTGYGAQHAAAGPGNHGYEYGVSFERINRGYLRYNDRTFDHHEQGRHRTYQDQPSRDNSNY